MSLLDRPQTFPDSIDSSNIVFHYTGQSFDNHDSALGEAYFVKKKGNYIRIIKRRSPLTGQMRYGIYSARKQ